MRRPQTKFPRQDTLWPQLMNERTSTVHNCECGGWLSGNDGSVAQQCRHNRDEWSQSSSQLRLKSVRNQQLVQLTTLVSLISGGRDSHGEVAGETTWALRRSSHCRGDGGCENDSTTSPVANHWSWSAFRSDNTNLKKLSNDRQH